MNESEIKPIVVLVAVDDLAFASVLVQILRSSALFPIKAAITKSLDQVVSYVRTNTVDVVLMDTWLSDYPHEVAIEILRRTSDTPVVVLTRSSKMDVVDPLKRLGAQAVLCRSPIDPNDLISSVAEVLESSDRGKPGSPCQQTGPEQTDTTDDGKVQGDASTIECDPSKLDRAGGIEEIRSSMESMPVIDQDISMTNLRLSGAMRLKEVLSGSVPAKEQQKRLRKRLFKRPTNEKD